MRARGGHALKLAPLDFFLVEDGSRFFVQAASASSPAPLDLQLIHHRHAG